jgi:hypothetical protein
MGPCVANDDPYAGPLHSPHSSSSFLCRPRVDGGLAISWWILQGAGRWCAIETTKVTKLTPTKFRKNDASIFVFANIHVMLGRVRCAGTTMSAPGGLTCASSEPKGDCCPYSASHQLLVACLGKQVLGWACRAQVASLGELHKRSTPHPHPPPPPTPRRHPCVAASLCSFNHPSSCNIEWVRQQCWRW